MLLEDWLQVEMQGEIVVLVYSYFGGLFWLSEVDWWLQVQSDLLWWLVCWGMIYKFCCVLYFIGWCFEYGVMDCYILFWDVYYLVGIEMLDFYCEDDWWCNGQNFYLDNLEVMGLYQVLLLVVQLGDVLLCCFGLLVLNYVVIYCGDGELLYYIFE